jgi:hypothetical protein
MHIVVTRYYLQYAVGPDVYTYSYKRRWWVISWVHSNVQYMVHCTLYSPMIFIQVVLFTRCQSYNGRNLNSRSHTYVCIVNSHLLMKYHMTHAKPMRVTWRYIRASNSLMQFSSRTWYPRTGNNTVFIKRTTFQSLNPIHVITRMPRLPKNLPCWR